MKVKILVSDLDSTLCNTAHRHDRTPYADPSLTWVDYSMLCAEDVPMVASIEVTKMALYCGWQVRLITGRNSEARELTETWLDRAQVGYHELRMKEPGDTRTNAEYKVDYIRELQDKGFEVALMLEDWPPVVEAIEALGVPVLCVNPRYVGEAGAVYYTDNPVSAVPGCK